MRPTTVALAALAIFTGTAYAQDTTRFVDRTRKATAVTMDKRLPVASGANTDPNSALDSIEAHQAASGVTMTQPAVFYSVLVTLSAGQGAGRLMLWDRASVPADGALANGDRPFRCIFIDAGPRTTALSSAVGLSLKNGMSWAFSSAADCQTKTSATINFVSVTYKMGAL